MAECIDPVVNSLNAPFWEGAAVGRLVLPMCTETGRAFWPPSPLSPYAGTPAVGWMDAEPAGILRSRITYRRAFQKPFEAAMPYGIGLVELVAGPRLLVHLQQPDAPNVPQPGDSVSIAFEILTEGGMAMPVILAR